MKYVVILGDGMADFRQPFLNDKTPLMIANKPNIDLLASKGEIGLVRTVPCGMKPGSDVANLSVLGYDPNECYTGRSPLEAASIGIKLKDTDVTVRANLVTVTDEQNYADKTMVDYSAGEISTAEAKQLIDFLKKEIDGDVYKLYAGISYRHCLVIDNGVLAGDFTPPHDITGKPIKEHLPKSQAGVSLLKIMEKSYELLKNHPVNVARVKAGKRPANSLWFWGEGTKPNLQSFFDRYGIKGGMISAVDLLKGIGNLTGMRVIDVEGATGNYDTNFKGKASACIEGLKSGLDFIYIHMEAPDECGHHGDAKNKIYSIELIDGEVVKPVVEYLESTGERYKILVAPDHPTPLSTMTHCADPVPYIIFDSAKQLKKITRYDEENAKQSGIFVQSGAQLMKKFLSE